MNRFKRVALAAVLGIFSMTAVLAGQLPEPCIGNWINPKTNEWTYGFFESFAIYQSDFWSYKSVDAAKKGVVTVVLEKDGEQVALTLKKGKANRSPEDTWKTIIKELDLTGPSMVQYRLPDEQQAMIERLFSVRKFPTYLLVDKTGKVVNTDATGPQQMDEACRQIEALLAK